MAHNKEGNKQIPSCRSQTLFSSWMAITEVDPPSEELTAYQYLYCFISTFSKPRSVCATQLSVHWPAKCHTILFPNEIVNCASADSCLRLLSWSFCMEAWATVEMALQGESDWPATKMANYMQKAQQPQKCPLATGQWKSQYVWMTEESSMTKFYFRYWAGCISGFLGMNPQKPIQETK